MKTIFTSPLVFSLLFVLVGVSAVFFQNCSRVDFSQSPVSAEATNSGVTVPPVVAPPSNPSSPGTAPAIGLYQPAMAVRDVSCLACHANIQASLITDFGAGNSWYLNQNGVQDRPGTTHYLPTSWQTIQQINGKVIVPDIQIPMVTLQASLPQGAASPISTISLSQYLTTKNMKDFDSEWFSYFGVPHPSSEALTNNVTGSATSQKYVYIGAPTSSEILGLVSNSNVGPWFQSVDPAKSVSGFGITNGVNGTAYVVNSGSVQCSNQDIVINGTLLLNNLQIYAEQGGCRLYVNGPVFIEGQITYLNSGSAVDATNNLQITSSMGIMMGVGINGTVLNSQSQTQSTNPLYDRLIGAGVQNNMVIRSAPDTGSYSNFANSILAAGQNIGDSILVDAANTGSSATALSGAKQPRVAINFTHLLLNAPIVHSRYLGNVSGVLIAESVMFSLGEFSFNYDPVFQTVPVLPALPKDILCVGSSSAGCNPAQQ